ncbi:MAG: RNA-dependent DNA polymerase [Verrucomicrobia bacterium]|nr:RNA-dependent DNA polymerase [Verrucomicrobiota bacterium]
MNPRQIRRVCSLEAIAAPENLWLAARKARRGKRRRPDVEDFELRRESELALLREELLSGAWQPGAYHFFEIFEPKRRVIAAAPYRDRVVHHALCNLLAPVIERRFVARSFSCQVGKGTTAARECCRRLTNRHRFVLKCDVAKFFPNIDHAILRERLAEWVACPGALGLIDRILASFRTTDPELLRTLPGDGERETARPRGLPIGNLTSQLWGNFILDALDHRLAEAERHGASVRYTDDLLIFGDDKARLWAMREVVVEELARARLRLAEPKSRLLATREGVPFCGFRFLPGLRPRVLGTTKRRFESRRFRWRRRRAAVVEILRGTFAWYQFSREGNTAGLRRAWANFGYRLQFSSFSQPGRHLRPLRELRVFA